MAATTMTYGAYSFSPVPMISLSEKFDKNSDDAMLGTTVSATLTGTLTPLPAATDGGLDQIIALQDLLRAAMETDGAHFVVKCGADTLIDKYPRVVDISFSQSNNNWTLTSQFTIMLEWDATQLTDTDNDSLAPYLKSSNDSWTIEFQDETKKFSWSANGTTDANSVILRVSRNIGAVGKRVYQSGGVIKEAWEQAQEWVTGRIGWDGGVGGDTILASQGVLNLSTGTYNHYNHMRGNTTDVTNGQFSVTENWLVMDTGVAGSPGQVKEDFSIDVRRGLDSDITTVGINGTIHGLEVRDYGTSPGDFTISTDRYASAIAAWPTISGRLYDRVFQASSGIASRTIHLTPTSRTLGHAHSQGSIRYDWQFNDRPCNYITGALSEVINISDTGPVDVFASLAVLGRAKGPILQSINTVTAPTKDIAIEVVMPPIDGCSDLAAAITGGPDAAVECLLKTVQDTLTAAYDQVFKTNDSRSWSPKTGRYSRNVSWTMGICTGSAVATTMTC